MLWDESIMRTLGPCGHCARSDVSRTRCSIQYAFAVPGQAVRSRLAVDIGPSRRLSRGRFYGSDTRVASRFPERCVGLILRHNAGVDSVATLCWPPHCPLLSDFFLALARRTRLRYCCAELQDSSAPFSKPEHAVGTARMPSLSLWTFPSPGISSSPICRMSSCDYKRCYHRSRARLV